MHTSSLPFRHPVKLICTWFGAGLSPKAPGTMGSLAALPCAWIIQSLWGNMALLLAAAIAFAAGWIATNHYLRFTDAKDPKEVVIDEVAGMWLLLAFMEPRCWQAYGIGFALFRLFDIVKPWPVSWADRTLKGGLSVMLDDILAALYPLLLVYAYMAATGHSVPYFL